MRINEKEKILDIERRDIEYVLGAYARLYLYQTKNQEPDRIIFPMFRSVPHPFIKGKFIPIEYIPDNSPVAVEIAEDASNIPLPSEASEAAADEKEKVYDQTKDTISKVEAEAKIVSPAKAAFNANKLKERIAKEPPGGAIPPGQATDYGASPDASASKIVRNAMRREKDIGADEEAAEKPDEEIVKRAKSKKTGG